MRGLFFSVRIRLSITAVFRFLLFKNDQKIKARRGQIVRAAPLSFQLVSFLLFVSASSSLRLEKMQPQ